MQRSQPAVCNSQILAPASQCYQSCPSLCQSCPWARSIGTQHCCTSCIDGNEQLWHRGWRMQELKSLSCHIHLHKLITSSFPIEWHEFEWPHSSNTSLPLRLWVLHRPACTCNAVIPSGPNNCLGSPPFVPQCCKAWTHASQGTCC